MKQFIYPYVMFKDSKKAAEYYISVFGGEVTYTMLGRDTPNCPDELLESVMHLQYKLNGYEFYFADANLEDNGRIHLHLDFENLDEMKTAFNNMSIEGKVVQELDETFWGAVFGNIIDKFNVTWQFHYSLPKN